MKYIKLYLSENQKVHHPSVKWGFEGMIYEASLTDEPIGLIYRF